MTTAPARTLSLLLVDDSELVRSGLKVLLGRPEYAAYLTIVGEASSVATAIEETGRLKPDLVLLDLRLPDGSGLEACRQILVRYPGVRVLSQRRTAAADGGRTQRHLRLVATTPEAP